MIDLFKRNVGRYECYTNKSLLIKQTRVAFKWHEARVKLPVRK